MSPQVWARVRIAVLLFVVALVQSALGSDLRVLSVAPDLMVLVAICAGLAGGTQAGAWVGFWAGLLADLLVASSTPVGLYALTYCLTGAAVGAARNAVAPESRLSVPAIALVVTATEVIAFVALGDLLGQHQLAASGRDWLVRVAFIEAVWSAVLALPAFWVYRLVARGSKGVADASGTTPGVVRRERALLP